MAAPSRRINICSLNCEGLSNAKPYIRHLIDSLACDILLLQETWLLESNLNQLNSLHPDFLAIGKSGVDERRGILPGRPYGGVAIVYRKTLAKCIKPVPSNCRRMCGVVLRLDSGPSLLLLSVYMPCDNYSMSVVNDEFLDTMNEIEFLMNASSSSDYIFGGDFNTSFDRNNAQSNCLSASLNAIVCAYVGTIPMPPNVIHMLTYH